MAGAQTIDALVFNPTSASRLHYQGNTESDEGNRPKMAKAEPVPLVASQQQEAKHHQNSPWNERMPGNITTETRWHRLPVGYRLKVPPRQNNPGRYVNYDSGAKGGNRKHDGQNPDNIRVRIQILSQSPADSAKHTVLI